jgi:nucleoside-diphosphate-sugar epimerase
MNIALLVKKIVEENFNGQKKIEIEIKESDDIRSYHINSEKILNFLGYKPKRDIEYGVKELCLKFKAGYFKDSFENSNYYNVKKLKELNVS